MLIYPGSIYLLKSNSRTTRTKCEICSKLTKTSERRTWNCRLRLYCVVPYSSVSEKDCHQAASIFTPFKTFFFVLSGQTSLVFRDQRYQRINITSQRMVSLLVLAKFSITSCTNYTQKYHSLAWKIL